MTGDSSGSISITLDGYFHATATSADWLITLDVSASGSDGSQSGSLTAHYGTQGDLTATTAGEVTSCGTGSIAFSTN